MCASDYARRMRMRTETIARISQARGCCLQLLEQCFPIITAEFAAPEIDALIGLEGQITRGTEKLYRILSVLLERYETQAEPPPPDVSDIDTAAEAWEPPLKPFSSYEVFMSMDGGSYP